MLIAIVLAIVSIAFFFLAVRDWRQPRAHSSAPRRRHGAFILVSVSLLLLGGLWGVSRVFDWERDHVLWVGLGGFLALATIVRPWWFWEHYKARWLRDLVGDEVTALFYFLMAGLMIWVGLCTNWRFGRH